MSVRPSSSLSGTAKRLRLGLSLALVAVLVFGAALALASVKAGKYKGTTSEKIAVSFTVSGKKVLHFKSVLGYNGKCGPGGGPPLTATPSAMKIASNGSFGQNTTLSLVGTPLHEPGRVFGKVSGSKVTGTIEQFLHGKVNRCYIETFTASRR